MSALVKGKLTRFVFFRSSAARTRGCAVFRVRAAAGSGQQPGCDVPGLPRSPVRDPAVGPARLGSALRAHGGAAPRAVHGRGLGDPAGPRQQRSPLSAKPSGKVAGGWMPALKRLCIFLFFLYFFFFSFQFLKYFWGLGCVVAFFGPCRLRRSPLLLSACVSVCVYVV